MTPCNVPKMHHQKYYATTIMLINNGVATNMMLTINIFPWHYPDFSLTAAKFPDIFGFSRKVVTMSPCCNKNLSCKNMVPVITLEWLEMFAEVNVCGIFVNPDSGNMHWRCWLGDTKVIPDCKKYCSNNSRSSFPGKPARHGETAEKNGRLKKNGTTQQ